MENRKGFRAVGSDPGDDIFRKFQASLGTSNFPEMIPEESQRKDRLLILLEYQMLHEDIIRRKKK